MTYSPLDKDEFEFLSFGCDCEPSGAAGLLVVLAFFEAEDFGVELEGFVLVADDDGDVGCFLDHCFTSSSLS
jgi:hypothetical protein